MTTAFDFSGASGAFNSFLGVGLPLIIILVFAGLGYFAFTSNIFTQRPYTVVERIPRSGGAFRSIIAKGRFLKKKSPDEAGRFEINYGLLENRVVNAPDEADVAPGELLECISKTKEEVMWIKSVSIAGENITLGGSVPEDAQLAYAVAYDSSYQRTHQMSAWMNYLPHIVFALCALGLIIASVWGTLETSKSEMAIATNLGATLDRFNNVTCVKEIVKTTPSTSLPGLPPG